MRPLWSSTQNIFLLLTYLLIYLISLLGSRRTFQIGWQWEPAPGLASNSCVDELKRKQPKTTLAAWNTNLKVVSNRLNQNPALFLQFLILLPVLHSLFAASLMGVRGKSIFWGRASSLGPWAAGLKSSLSKSRSGTALQVLLWGATKRSVTGGGIFYYLLFAQLWECLERAWHCHCCCPKEHEWGESPVKGKVVEFVTGIFRGFYFNFLTMGYLNFFLQCCSETQMMGTQHHLRAALGQLLPWREQVLPRSSAMALFLPSFLPSCRALLPAGLWSFTFPQGGSQQSPHLGTGLWIEKQNAGESTPATGAGQAPAARGTSSSAGNTEGQRGGRCWNPCSWILCPSFKPGSLLLWGKTPLVGFFLWVLVQLHPANGAQREMWVLQQLLGQSWGANTWTHGGVQGKPLWLQGSPGVEMNQQQGAETPSHFCIPCL